MKAKIQPRINLEDRTALQEVIPLSTPMVLFADPASACNFQCKFCPNGDRELMRLTGRFQGLMKLDLLKKVIDDLADFQRKIKVLRLYKDGEPFLNKNLAEMVAYAKKSGCVEYIDTTTNASLLDPERVKPVIDAGLNKINISVYGLVDQTYKEFCRYDFDFEKFIRNLSWLYDNKGSCEIVVKIPNELLKGKNKDEFFKVFGDISDRVFVENFAPCWPDFDVRNRTGVKLDKGIYDQPIGSTDVCPYIFYSMSVNADGFVSMCFLDWGRKLLIGDAKTERLIDIWNSAAMNDHRFLHLEGRRKQHPLCGKCGQLSHCLPDSIDPYRVELLSKMKDCLAIQK